MDHKAKMHEIYDFFKANESELLAVQDEVAYHVIFINKTNSNKDKGEILISGGAERTEALLMLMFHIDSLRKSIGSQIKVDDFTDWINFIHTIYLITIAENPDDDTSYFSSTSLRIPKI